MTVPGPTYAEMQDPRLIHNVGTTDYVLLVHDEDALWGLVGVQETPLAGTFGISSVANVIASVTMAQHLGLSRGDNVVTVATDGFDRYPSVIEDLARRAGRQFQSQMIRWCSMPFAQSTPAEVLDVRGPEQKERLYRQKETAWTRLGYPPELLLRMRGRAFWEEEAGRVAEVDRRYSQVRGGLG